MKLRRAPPSEAQIVREQSAVLRRLGLLSDEQLGQLVDVTGLGDTYFGGFAVPPKGLVYIRPDIEISQEIYAHELSHILSHRLGYLDSSRVLFKQTSPIDPLWVDLDAMLAAWALEEGTAELTGAIATAYSEQGESGVREIWGERTTLEVELGSDVTTGPVTVRNSAGEVIIKMDKGERYAISEDSDIARKLIGFVYAWSPEYVKRKCPPPVDPINLDRAFSPRGTRSVIRLGR